LDEAASYFRCHIRVRFSDHKFKNLALKQLKNAEVEGISTQNFIFRIFKGKEKKPFCGRDVLLEKPKNRAPVPVSEFQLLLCLQCQKSRVSMTTV